MLNHKMSAPPHMPSSHFVGRVFIGKVLALLLMLSLVSGSLGAFPYAAEAAVYESDLIGSTPLADVTLLVEDAPDITADYAALITSDGQVLWQRDVDAEVPMASTTKIMTAIVALENSDVNTQMVTSADAAAVEGTGAELEAGDVTSLGDLLYGLLLPSGNDAAIVIAENVGGSTDAFVDMMNAKAQELGMDETHYANPHGLQNEDHYTSVSDFMVLVRYAMQNETFRTVVGTQEKTVSIGGREITYENTNLLFDTFEGTIGVKTGFTDQAGYCLIGAAQRSGVELYSIALHASDASVRFDDGATLLEWGFTHYRKIELINATTTVGEVAVTDRIDTTIPVTVAAPVALYTFDYAGDIVQNVELEDTSGTVEVGDELGTISWIRDGEVLASAPLVATVSIAAPDFFERIQIAWDRFWGQFSGEPSAATTTVLVGDIYTVAPEQS